MNNPFASGSSGLNNFGVAGTNYCGPNYANGTFGQSADPGGITTGPIDALCKAHDLSYDNALGSPTEWTQKLAADERLINDTRQLFEAGQLSDYDKAIAIAVLAAFDWKVNTVDYPVALAEALKNLTNSLKLLRNS